MIALNNIGFGYGGRKIFDAVSFLIGPKDMIGLVGHNGSGKTTLLRLVMGRLSPESGNIERPAQISMGYLPQQMKHEDTGSLYDEARSTFEVINSLEEKIKRTSREISERTDVHSSSFLRLTDRLADLNEMAHVLGASKVDEQIEKVLAGLGFSPSDFSRQTSQFSGGWRMRIELAKILLKDPDILLLDEPTNHLDIESIQWLEEFLQDYHGAALIISHDRAFLDNTTARTIEISLGRLYDYKATYSQYEQLREERRRQQTAALKNQQKAMASQQLFIDRFRYKNTKASLVQSRIKKMEKNRPIEIDPQDNRTISLFFPETVRSGDLVLEARSISKSYGAHTVLENIDLSVHRGDRIAFVGKNGQGKTTLSKIIVGELDHEGSLKTGHQVRSGFFAQDQDERLDEELTVYETVFSASQGQTRQKIRGLLGAFLFQDEDIDKKVKVLSGGERSRLALIRLLLEPCNLLVMDEPTNHLDMRSKDILKAALQDFGGTLILVSHDRHFLEGLIEKVYEFKDRRIIEHLGTVQDFLEKKKIESLQALELGRRQGPSRDRPEGKSSSKEAYLQKKDTARLYRMTTKKIAACEDRIETLEKKLAEVTLQIQSEDYAHTDPQSLQKYEAYARIKADLDKAMQMWERLQQEAAGLEKRKNP